MAELVTNLLVGLGLGCIYGLVGLSFMGIYNATGVLNFAQGDLLMLGGVIPALFATSLHVPTVLAVICGIVIAVFAALVLQVVLIEPLLGRNVGIIPMAIGTFAFSLVVEGIVGGASTFGSIPAIQYVGFSPIRFGSVLLARQYLIIIVVTVVVTALYWVFLHKVHLGVAIRAVGSSARGAMGIGLHEKRIQAVAFGISAIIASVAGFLVAPLVSAGVSMGFPLLLNGFVAAVVGGMGRAFSPLLGGVLLGEFVSLVGAYGLPAYANLVSLGLLLVIILIRPEGLLGTVGRGVIDH